MNIRLDAQIAEVATRNDGCSYELSTGEWNPRTGYMVGNEAENQRFGRVARFYPNGFDTRLKPADLSEHINRHSEVFNTPGVYVGIWRDGDVWIVEPSQRVEDGDLAMKLAKERNEKAIWDCARGCAIPNPDYTPPRD